MSFKSEVLEHANKIIKDRFGITYDEYLMLDFDEQQKLWNQYRKNQKGKSCNKHVDVMVGYGEHSTFLRVNKGEDVMVRYGNIIEAGLTREEEQQRLEDDLDDILYSKPVAFVRKLKRRIRK